MTIVDEILLALAALLAFTVGVLLIVNADLRAEMAQVRANATALASVNLDWKDKTERQNKAMQELRAAEVVKNATAAAAVKRAAEDGRKFVAEADRLARRQVAQSTPDQDCGEARAVLHDYLEHRP
jgi:hypothetical protein